MNEAAVAAKVLCDLLDHEDALVKSFAKNYPEFAAITPVPQPRVSIKIGALMGRFDRSMSQDSIKAIEQEVVVAGRKLSLGTVQEGRKSQEISSRQNSSNSSSFKSVEPENSIPALIATENSEPCSRSVVSNVSSKPSEAPPPAGESVVASASPESESEGDKTSVESDSELVCESAAPCELSPRSLPPPPCDEEAQPRISTASAASALPAAPWMTGIKTTSSDESENSSTEEKKQAAPEMIASPSESELVCESTCNSAAEEQAEPVVVMEEDNSTESETSGSTKEQEKEEEQKEEEQKPANGVSATTNGVSVVSENKEVDNKPTQEDINSQFAVLPWLRAAGEDNVPLLPLGEDNVTDNEDDMHDGEESTAPSSPLRNKPEFARKATITLDGGHLKSNNDAFFAMMSSRH